MPANGPNQNEDEVERRLEARMLRQQILNGPESPHVHAVIDEAALRRCVGGAEVMHEQLSRITEAARRPDATVQVLPFATGAYMPVQGADS